MDPLKLFPERIISGFFHLGWIVLLGLILLRIAPQEIYAELKVISAGTVALLASIIIGASYYLGNLSDRVIADIVAIYCKLKKIKPKHISDLSNIKVINSEKLIDLKNSYIDKAFFRSIFIAGLLLILFSLIWNFCNGGNRDVFICIVIIGFILELTSLRIVFVLRKHYNEEFDKIDNQS